MMPHWSERYLGIPWASGAQGPDAFDCWAFFRYIQRRHYGRELPIVSVDANDRPLVRTTFATHSERSRWVPTEHPSDGDGALFHKAGQVDHVGLWVAVDGGRILHAIPHSGVVLTNLVAARRLGWNPIEFYRFQP